jgi:hypothetical protein
MTRHGWWIAGAAALIAVAAIVALFTRGPASGRAPVQHGGAARSLGDGAHGDAPADGGTVRVTIGVLPKGSSPEWTLELRDGGGTLHAESGTGERECAIGPVSAGRALLTLRARGFVGETRHLDVGSAEVIVSASLRQFGRVSGRLHCDGMPVGGALVRLAMARDSLSMFMDLAEEDRVPEMGWSVESDGDGRYRFDRVPPAEGFTLVAADFDHSPAHADPFDVKPGVETTVDIVMPVGSHLAGRVVDSRGAPCAGTTVHVYIKRTKLPIIGWVDEARARTDDDGRFVTPALTGPEPRMLKAWVAVDGVQQIIQHETEPPERGTKDVGTLAPLPGIVLFEAESMTGKGPFKMTVAVNGDPPGVGQGVVVNDLALDREGRARVMGFPVGEGVYSVSNADDRSVAEGKFRTTGRDMVVKIPAFVEPAPRPPKPEESLVVEVAETGEDAIVALIGDGEFLMWRQVRKDDRSPVIERVPPGSYTLHVTAGDRYSQQEVTQVKGADLKLSVLPDRIGRSFTILVLQDGKPVPGARVQLRGFRAGARGQRVPWAEGGEDGRVVLRGLPPDLSALTATVLNKEGQGRTYPIEVTAAGEATVDLAKAPGEQR